VRRAAIVLGLVAALFAGSCGGSELPTRLAATLQDRVASIRERAEADQPGRARAALQGLVELVISRLETGRIDEGRAMEILEAAEAVGSQLSLLPQPSPTQDPSPSPSHEEGSSGDGNGKGKGKGKGDEEHGNDE
jgi:hypothetical protein